MSHGKPRARPAADPECQLDSSIVSRSLEEWRPSAGVTRAFLTTKGPYRDPDSNIIGIVGISRDITERRELDDACLRELHLHLSLVELPQACRGIDEASAARSSGSRSPTWGR